ncbi:MAG: cytochrome ubiquinol oxidase subunit I [Planctomycetia bacterium]|nr:cytochrome ubiquinol oxidase subunit I [Planctomycetia bacterium]
MHYPWWYIPGLTAPMLIAIVAVVHVIVSHYAVGGGLLLALENGHALRQGDEAYRNYWKKHAKFFILLTVVFGAITGVGIWWTIGLASPLATEFLIRTFVFGWAIEWCFFILELVAAFGFYYFWTRLKPRTHAIMGWIYGLSAWISLVLITGITAFMLNSGTLLGQLDLAADPYAVGTFWQSFLNAQLIPQTVLRTGGALILATFYVYLHASLCESNAAVREKVVRRMRIPSLLGVLLLLTGLVGWFWFLPSSSLTMLQSAAAMNIFGGLFLAVFVAIVLLLWVGPIRNPQKMTTGLALALFLFGLAGVGIGEFVREAVRKPFIVDRLVYGHQIFTSEVNSVRSRGVLESGLWTRLYLEQLQEKYPNLKLAPKRPVQSFFPAKSPMSSHIMPIPSVLDLSSSEDSVIRQTQLQLQMGGNPQPASPPVGQALPLDDSYNFQPTALTANYQAPAAEAPRASAEEALPLPEDPAAESVATDAEQVAPEPPKVARPIEQGIITGNQDMLLIAEDDRIAAGRVLFMYHCNDCHASEFGYSAVAPMLTGKRRDEIRHFLVHLNRPGFYMPPWCGTLVEAELLTDYLLSIRPDMPHNLEVDIQ